MSDGAHTHQRKLFIAWLAFLHATGFAEWNEHDYMLRSIMVEMVKRISEFVNIQVANLVSDPSTGIT